MRLAAYVRVSTDTQAEHGLGLEVQRDAIHAWADEHGHQIDAYYYDAGVSGSNGLEGRVGLVKAFKQLGAGAAEGLVVYRLDRLARDLIVQEQLIAELKRLGAALFSTASGEAQYLEDDPRDPSRKLIRQVLGAVSEYERAMVRLRLAAGRQAKADRGGYAYGAPPYGYRAVDGELVEDAAELEVIRLMREWYKAGWTWRDVARELNRRGVPTQRNGEWHADSCRRIVQRT